MVDAIIIAKSVKVENQHTRITLFNNVELVVKAKIEVPRGYEGPLIITISGDKVGIAKLIGPCTLWSTLRTS